MKTLETNKAESKDATQDKVEVFNEDTCNVCLIFFNFEGPINTQPLTCLNFNFKPQSRDWSLT